MATGGSTATVGPPAPAPRETPNHHGEANTRTSRAPGTLERVFLNHFQGGFPLTERPFQLVATELGTDEQTLLDAIDRMLDDRLLTRFGPLFNAERLGGRFTLAAMEVPEVDFERTANVLMGVSEVAHNYRRDHRLNMWFVLATPSEGELKAAIRRVQSLTGLAVLDFPKLGEYHLGFWLHLEADGRVGVRRVERDKPTGPLDLDNLDRAIIAATQGGYPLTRKPFDAIATQTRSDSRTVLARLGRMLEAGAIRRIGAVPNHYRLGLRGNGMSVWDLDDEQVDALGARIGALDFVSHCYRRPRHLPVWPYNLFAMVHGHDRDEVETAVARIADMVANYLPHTLVVLDARDLSPVKVIPVVDSNGRSSRVSAVYTADPRYSFIVALKDLSEVWEISYQIPPPRGFGRWIHDYRTDSGEEMNPDPFPIRRIKVEGILDDFFIDQEYVEIAGSSRDGKGQVVDLDLGRAVTQLALPGLPHLSSGITWPWEEKIILATPNIKESKVTVLDTKTWKVIKEIPTLGPGFFMRSHESSPYAWVDVFFGKDKDAMHVIDKKTLEVVKTLRPAPGKTSAHVEFTKDGRYALVSIWDPDGAVVVYDATSLEEVKRLPMIKPSGKYNVHNKLSRSSGTSH